MRFVRAAANDEPMPLRDVPPIVFSEAMRDVDLFVVGDLDRRRPDWPDGGRAAATDALLAASY